MTADNVVKFYPRNAALTFSYSPEREKGRKKILVSCPHCDTIGGKPIMYRFHFEKCKNK